MYNYNRLRTGSSDNLYAKRKYGPELGVWFHCPKNLRTQTIALVFNFCVNCTQTERSQGLRSLAGNRETSLRSLYRVSEIRQCHHCKKNHNLSPITTTIATIISTSTAITIITTIIVIANSIVIATVTTRATTTTKIVRYHETISSQPTDLGEEIMSMLHECETAQGTYEHSGTCPWITGQGETNMT
ncbi:uncharacterized protein LOC143026797 [Oratosquilla oratoria]|uniref:uncharacterized protein LOC143026797 n=1 Tax=Oratosquilla oratoria TaxID=337810 RepID=UPI003F75D713